ncbi:MAG: hypothetical protein ACRC6X_07935 [Culicoidibacterales bacterium]
MQAVMETIFDIFYLGTVITIGVVMVRGAGWAKQYYLFGVLALILGFGDAFHLIPRAFGLITGTMGEQVFWLGLGKLITSITMTIFYVLLYRFWRLRYHVHGGKEVSILIYALAGLRIGLCLFPQNQWFVAESPVIWGIYRNIPFLLLGLIIIYLFAVKAKMKRDNSFKFAWVAISASFILYIPVVLWADKFPLVGVLMIPKTLAYLWLIMMGYLAFRQKRNN